MIPDTASLGVQLWERRYKGFELLCARAQLGSDCFRDDCDCSVSFYRQRLSTRRVLKPPIAPVNWNVT